MQNLTSPQPANADLSNAVIDFGSRITTHPKLTEAEKAELLSDVRDIIDATVAASTVRWADLPACKVSKVRYSAGGVVGKQDVPQPYPLDTLNIMLTQAIESIFDNEKISATERDALIGSLGRLAEAAKAAFPPTTALLGPEVKMAAEAFIDGRIMLNGQAALTPDQD